MSLQRTYTHVLPSASYQHYNALPPQCRLPHTATPIERRAAARESNAAQRSVQAALRDDGQQQRRAGSSRPPASTGGSRLGLGGPHSRLAGRCGCRLQTPVTQHGGVRGATLGTSGRAGRGGGRLRQLVSLQQELIAGVAPAALPRVHLHYMPHVLCVQEDARRVKQQLLLRPVRDKSQFAAIAEGVVRVSVASVV